MSGYQSNLSKDTKYEDLINNIESNLEQYDTIHTICTTYLNTVSDHIEKLTDGKHFVLIKIDVRYRKIDIFDSMDSIFYRQNLLIPLSEFLEIRLNWTKNEADDKNFTMNMLNKQRDNQSCGVFSTAYLYSDIRGTDKSKITQDEVNKQREKLAKGIKKYLTV